jgi:quercetin dioxygenase-like cupin family protein
MRTVIASLALLAASVCAEAAELNPAAITIRMPDKLTWRDPESAGANQAILHGDPNKPGLYIVINKFKPGNMSKPHYHPNDRFITVLKGTWWVGTGTKGDPNATVGVPAGGFVTHYAKQVHYDGAKDEEVMLLIVGEGPATRTEVPE